MASIHSLGLPIPSLVLLALQVLDHSAVLEPAEAFQQAVASFRGIVSGHGGMDGAARLPR